ncbi:hypothetical protein PG997_013392 [Apiospora hydei]|uniref:Uncharacterized protein n=1 Tax=Apiospora hydei TaxID=1337664 RepID=A0ABR1V635_9PEZI
MTLAAQVGCRFVGGRERVGFPWPGAERGGRRRCDHGRVAGSGGGVESASSVAGRLDGDERVRIRNEGRERRVRLLLAGRRVMEATQMLCCYIISRLSLYDWCWI